MKGKHERSISAKKSSPIPSRMPTSRMPIGKWFVALEKRLSSYRYFNGLVGIFTYLVVILFFALACLDDAVFEGSISCSNLTLALKMFGDAIVPTTLTFVAGVCTQGLFLLRDKASEAIAVTFVFLYLSIAYAILFVLSRKSNCFGLMLFTNVILSFLFARYSVYALPSSK